MCIRDRDDASRALELEPRQKEAWSLRGQVRGALGDWAGQRADLSRSLELDPARGLVWAQRAHACERLGDWEGAVQGYERALSRDPGAPWAEKARQRLARAQRRLAAR